MRTNTKKGFTLIELLIVIVIIGILAAIAIPKFAATKDKAKLASAKTDIRNFMTAEEAYFSDHATYSTTLSDITGGTNPLMNLSPGNTASVTAAGTGGYTVIVGNATIAGTPKGCSVTANSGVATDGTITCTETAAP
jgi:prepilin-type N-terminal cleavage/methylation domain-containing protein